jgi:hypothetical protein
VQSLAHVIVQTLDGKDQFIDNPYYKVQLIQYDAKVQEHEAYTELRFTNGLSYTCGKRQVGKSEIMVRK